MFRRLLASTRFLILLPIVGTFLAALGLMVFETIALALRLLDFLQGTPSRPRTSRFWRWA